MRSFRIIHGDALAVLRSLPDESAHCCVTSPPYWGLRDYGVPGQLGLEKTPEEFVVRMTEVFSEVRRVLRADGTCWVNLGSSYAGGGRGGNPEESAFRKQATNVGSLVPRTTVPGGDEPFALRDGLSGDVITYVLAELAAYFRECSEVSEPDLTVGIDQAVTPLADGGEV